MSREAKHTPEPWMLDEWRHPIGSNGRTIVVDGFSLVSGPQQPEAEANTRRILACVAACAGIPTEQLEAGCVKDLLLALKDARTILVAVDAEATVGIIDETLVPFQKDAGK